MCFYYILHSLRNDKSKDSNGQKNTRTFIFGSMLYIIVFMVIMHFSLKRYKIFDILKAGLIMMFIVDAAVMFYVYKSYYGRSITRELFDNDEKYRFDKDKDKYEKKTDGDIKLENEIDKVKTDYHQIEIDRIKELIDRKKNQIKDEIMQIDIDEINKIEDEIPEFNTSDNNVTDEEILNSLASESNVPDELTKMMDKESEILDETGSIYDSSLGTLMEESSSETTSSSSSYESDSSENYATENDDTTYNGNSLETNEESKISKNESINKTSNTSKSSSSNTEINHNKSVDNSSSNGKEANNKKSNDKSSLENIPYDVPEETKIITDEK